ncbi:hypothetical protein M422DRAFT_68600 [Sphaerobolus stellatus SS14]|uniref:Uncharacterized protein n=1 Tax=Sphaerobolus stellatus (strain SS14) TaxID=990650 RepID=A0A0C9VQ54_SPHS4|nr:hypothetical protein M422DRAFT_68600 [Sphaerobolus stellatus SS14]
MQRLRRFSLSLPFAGKRRQEQNGDDGEQRRSSTSRRPARTRSTSPAAAHDSAISDSEAMPGSFSKTARRRLVKKRPTLPAKLPSQESPPEEPPSAIPFPSNTPAEVPSASPPLINDLHEPASMDTFLDYTLPDDSEVSSTASPRIPSPAPLSTILEQDERSISIRARTPSLTLNTVPISYSPSDRVPRKSSDWDRDSLSVQAHALLEIDRPAAPEPPEPPATPEMTATRAPPKIFIPTESHTGGLSRSGISAISPLQLPSPLVIQPTPYASLAAAVALASAPDLSRLTAPSPSPTETTLTEAYDTAESTFGEDDEEDHDADTTLFRSAQESAVLLTAQSSDVVLNMPGGFNFGFDVDSARTSIEREVDVPSPTTPTRTPTLTSKDLPIPRAEEVPTTPRPPSPSAAKERNLRIEEVQTTPRPPPLSAAKERDLRIEEAQTTPRPPPLSAAKERDLRIEEAQTTPRPSQTSAPRAKSIEIVESPAPKPLPIPAEQDTPRPISSVVDRNSHAPSIDPIHLAHASPPSPSLSPSPSPPIRSSFSPNVEPDPIHHTAPSSVSSMSDPRSRHSSMSGSGEEESDMDDSMDGMPEGEREEVDEEGQMGEEGQEGDEEGGILLVRVEDLWRGRRGEAGVERDEGGEVKADEKEKDGKDDGVKEEVVPVVSSGDEAERVGELEGTDEAGRLHLHDDILESPIDSPPRPPGLDAFIPMTGPMTVPARSISTVTSTSASSTSTATMATAVSVLIAEPAVLSPAAARSIAQPHSDANTTAPAEPEPVSVPAPQPHSLIEPKPESQSQPIMREAEPILTHETAPQAPAASTASTAIQTTPPPTPPPTAALLSFPASIPASEPTRPQKVDKETQTVELNIEITPRPVLEIPIPAVQARKEVGVSPIVSFGEGMQEQVKAQPPSRQAVPYPWHPQIVPISALPSQSQSVFADEVKPQPQVLASQEPPPPPPLQAHPQIPPDSPSLSPSQSQSQSVFLRPVEDLWADHNHAVAATRRLHRDRDPRPRPLSSGSLPETPTPSQIRALEAELNKELSIAVQKGTAEPMPITPTTPHTPKTPVLNPIQTTFLSPPAPHRHLSRSNGAATEQLGEAQVSSDEDASPPSPNGLILTPVELLWAPGANAPKLPPGAAAPTKGDIEPVTSSIVDVMRSAMASSPAGRGGSLTTSANGAGTPVGNGTVNFVGVGASTGYGGTGAGAAYGSGGGYGSPGGSLGVTGYGGSHSVSGRSTPGGLPEIRESEEEEEEELEQEQEEEAEVSKEEEDRPWLPRKSGESVNRVGNPNGNAPGSGNGSSNGSRTRTPVEGSKFVEVDVDDASITSLKPPPRPHTPTGSRSRSGSRSGSPFLSSTNGTSSLSGSPLHLPPPGLPSTSESDLLESSSSHAPRSSDAHGSTSTLRAHTEPASGSPKDKDKRRRRTSALAIFADFARRGGSSNANANAAAAAAIGTSVSTPTSSLRTTSTAAHSSPLLSQSPSSITPLRISHSPTPPAGPRARPRPRRTSATPSTSSQPTIPTSLSRSFSSITRSLTLSLSSRRLRKREPTFSMVRPEEELGLAAGLRGWGIEEWNGRNSGIGSLALVRALEGRGVIGGLEVLAEQAEERERAGVDAQGSGAGRERARSLDEGERVRDMQREREKEKESGDEKDVASGRKRKRRASAVPSLGGGPGAGMASFWGRGSASNPRDGKEKEKGREKEYDEAKSKSQTSLSQSASKTLPPPPPEPTPSSSAGKKPVRKLSKKRRKSVQIQTQPAKIA